MRNILACVAVCFAVSAFAGTGNTSDDDAAKRQIVKSLHWIKGPTTVSVGTNAKFDVPEGYVFLNVQDTAKMMAVMENPPQDGETFFAPRDLSWFATFDYDDTGHIADDQKIDADAVLESVKQGNEQANRLRAKRGWAPVEVVGWRYPPFYENRTKRLEWAIDARGPSGVVVNYNTRILGRTGVTSATLVAGPEQLQTTVAEFKKAVAGYKYLPDQNYQAFRPGDHVAAYGLAALITGGAAAVAVKTGFWKVLVGALAAFWKVIVAGVVAVFAAIGRIFKRRA